MSIPYKCTAEDIERQLEEECPDDAMECPSCGEVALVKVNTIECEVNSIHESFDEFECRECHHYETS